MRRVVCMHGYKIHCSRNNMKEGISGCKAGQSSVVPGWGHPGQDWDCHMATFVIPYGHQ